MRQSKGERVTVSVKDKYVRFIARGDFLTYRRGKALPAKIHTHSTAN